MPFDVGSLVRFKRVLNARKYPLTGFVTEASATHVTVEAFGYNGLGSTTLVHDVPVEELDDISNETW